MVKAVKDKGGLFLLQLWHVGRASHTGQYCTSASQPSPHCSLQNCPVCFLIRHKTSNSSRREFPHATHPQHCCLLCERSADYQPNGGLPVSSSAIAIGEDFEVYTPNVSSARWWV